MEQAAQRRLGRDWWWFSTGKPRIVWSENDSPLLGLFGGPTLVPLDYDTLLAVVQTPQQTGQCEKK